MIFVISLHRSGTQSLHTYLNSIGYRAIHNPTGRKHFDCQHLWNGRELDRQYIFDTIIDRIYLNYNAISDNPTGVLYKEAFVAFPDAKFVLSIRDVQKWIISIRNHIGSRDFVPAEKVQYWHYLKNKPTSINDVTDEELIELYNNHTDAIIEFFESVKATHQLCIIDLEDGDTINAEKLSNFFNVPTHPFLRIDNNNSKTAIQT
jgi:hypothetical protein